MPYGFAHTFTRLILATALAIPIAGCVSAKRESIGGRLPAAPNSTATAIVRGEIDVLLVSFDDALEIAYQAAKSRFVDQSSGRVRKLPNSVRIESRVRWMGNADGSVIPKLVENVGPDGGHGFTYEIRSWSKRGSGATLYPEYVEERFLSALRRYRQARNIRSARFTRYRRLEDRGVPETIGRNIPTSYRGFESYLKKKHDLGIYEGIWSDQNGRNVLGIVRDKSDPLYDHKAFVISSKDTNWKPGEIKIRFNRLQPGNASVSELWGKDKRKIGVTWRSDPGYMVTLTMVRETDRTGQIALIKTYPSTTRARGEAVGTGWAIGDEGVFITNAHVVQGAREVRIGARTGNAAKAQVLAIDSRLDLAILKLGNPGKSLRPLPVSIEREPNGSEVTVLGYPFAFQLGDDMRVTTGVISAQSGYAKDITRYQISAAVQGGSSGGPVINNRGQVVGIVVSRLARPDSQNVNFAVKAAYLKLLLDQAGIPYPRKGSPTPLSSRQLAERFKTSVLPIWTKR